MMYAKVGGVNRDVMGIAQFYIASPSSPFLQQMVWFNNCCSIRSSTTAARNDLQPRIIIQSDVDGNSECKARYFFVQFFFDSMSQYVGVIWIVCGILWVSMV